MGLFCGKVCKCKKRCKGAFPTNKALRKGCEAVCKTDSNLNVADYPCNIGGFQDTDFMATFGYDPCLDSGQTLEDFLDPLDTAGQAKEKQEAMKPYILGGIALVVLALIVLLVIIFK